MTDIFPHESTGMSTDCLGFLTLSQGKMSAAMLKVIESAPILLAALNSEMRIIFATSHHGLLADAPEHFLSVKSYLDLFPAELREQFEVKLSSEESGSITWEVNLSHKDGGMRIYQFQVSPLTDDFLLDSELLSSEAANSVSIDRDGIELEGGEKNLLVMGIDVTEMKLAEEALREQKSQIAYSAFHDPLTGLANRSLFYDRMDRSLSRVKRSGDHLALLLVDLDGFKDINENWGRDTGDRFLKFMAGQLRNIIRDTDTVARLSGDQFVIILENVIDSEDIEKIANKLLASLSKPLRVQGKEVLCTASMGISLYPKDGSSTDKLLRQADLAMYSAKVAGKNRLQFYVRAMTDTAVNYLLVENDLRKAIENEELVVYYQPQIDLKTRNIVGLEALVRWQHPERGIISPSDFIPLAEETGLIEPLGEWVLRHSCERFNYWLSEGFDLGKVAVNLSPRIFRKENFEQFVQTVLDETGLPTRYLELEITESSIMENAASTINVLNELNKMGLSLAIDDFGTGYSSLAYLKQFPVDKLKVDRSFISDIDSDENDAAIAKSIIDLGHNMSLKVIAEGVERESQTQWLLDKGCDQVQGYYYSKPLTETELMDMVRLQAANEY